MKTDRKNKILKDLSDLIITNSNAIIAANKLDLINCPKGDEALFDRLKVNDAKIKGMQASVLKVMQLTDPEGQLLYKFQKEEDLLVENRVVPFGRILIIYESRPDVTIEAAITAFKAGNQILLKGGKEAINTNLVLVELWHKALEKNKEDKSIVQYLDYDRNQTQKLIQNGEIKIDVIIPRGGERLINSIRENTDIPLIISGRGNNFMYIDKTADFDMAIKIILDGKKRISVCNALDKVYIHQSLNNDYIRRLIGALKEHFIKIVADNIICSLDDSINQISDEKVFYEEFLASKILLAKVDTMKHAIDGINRFSGGHSAVIVTHDKNNAVIFQDSVDCAAVYHNASTRYTDGGEFGLGAEIAISTQKLHFRGPVGLNELVTNKWFVTGNGNVRG